MKILLVDDNLDRMRFINSKLPDNCELKYVTTKVEAIHELASTIYDIAIVDLIIPETTSDKYPSVEAGRSLLETISITNRIFTPIQVVGITVGEDIYEENRAFFLDRLIPLLHCDTEDKWISPLINLINRTKKVSKIYNENIDVAIITAIEEEYNEAVNLPIFWETQTQLKCFANCKIGMINKHSVCLVKLDTMGLVSAAAQTMEVIKEFHPKLVCMIGICAGIKGKSKKGDLIIAEKSWDYGNGKILPDKGNGYYYSFDAEPNQICIDTELLRVLQNNCEKYLQQSYEEWNKIQKCKKSSNLKIGALPSGAAVVQDEQLIKSIILPQYRKCLGIDMETYGVYYACNYNKLKPKFLSMKAVVDFADSKKDDKYHRFCSYISAQTLYKLLVNNFDEMVSS